ncbi:MAG TPA: hypothetical protein VL527_03865, partial [Dongiaceae bacterium]|nr:hypothetical protein [Dongiaceae bacterium]
MDCVSVAVVIFSTVWCVLPVCGEVGFFIQNTASTRSTTKRHLNRSGQGEGETPAAYWESPGVGLVKRTK